GGFSTKCREPNYRRCIRLYRNWRVRDAMKQPVRWAISHGIPRVALRAAARHSDPQARLVAEATVSATAGLTGLFDEIRARGPLVQARFSYVTATHSTVKEVLSSNDFRTGIGTVTNGLLRRLGEWSTTDILSPMRPPSLLVT